MGSTPGRTISVDNGAGRPHTVLVAGPPPLTRRQSPIRSASPEPPPRISPIVGRASELAELERLLGSSRLLTLTGPGGSGKTSLAAELARRVAGAFTIGPVWVELAPLADPALLPGQLAAALGLRKGNGRTTLESVSRTIGARPALLVLDNCEHLIEACAELAARLLADCSGATLLTTSREPLGLAGEIAWRVPPLSLPAAGAASVDEAAASEAVRLFVERARGVCPRFELEPANAAAVAAICRRLDGLPLALELAAARVRVLSLEQILERLDDGVRLLTGGDRGAPERHRTLRSTLEWSYRLLADQEKLLLARLSVFADRFSLAAVEAVCPGGALAAPDVLDRLAALVDKSLVTMEVDGDEARYRLLEVTRQFARERLDESGEADAVADRHAAFFLGVAEEAEIHLFGGASDPERVARLERDLAELRAAADRFERRERQSEALRLAWALHWFWFARGLLEEGRRRLTAALAGTDAVASRERARALIAYGTLLLWQGEPEPARRAMEEGVALARSLDESWAVAYALAGVGAARCLDGDQEAARTVLEEAVAAARREPSSVLIPFALYWQGSAARLRGDLAAARVAYEEAVAVGRQIGHRPAIAHPLTVLARLLHQLGDPAGARARALEALAIHGEIDDRWGTVQALEVLARVAATTGGPGPAVRLVGAAARLRDAIGAPLLKPEQEELDLLLETLRAELGPEPFGSAWRAGRETSLAEVLCLAAGLAAESEAPPAPAPVAGGEVAPRLEVHALGPLRILLDGRPAAGNGWEAVRPRELLVHLLCHPEGCTREQIGLSFWPEASPAQLRNTFHVTLHRLRRALGHSDWIVADGGRYRLNPALDCEFDAARFETEAGAVLAVAAPGEAELDRLAAALELYRGDFLQNEPMGDWLLPHRERLQRLCLQGLEVLGEARMAAGRWAEAAALWHRLLGLEDLDEAVYQRLMLCHARLGQRRRVLEVFESLRQLLQDELGAEPEAATVALCRRLTRPATAPDRGGRPPRFRKSGRRPGRAAQLHFSPARCGAGPDAALESP